MNQKIETYEQYISYCVKTWEASGQRFGQYLFNTLYRVNPRVSDMVRNTDLDPYYSKDFEVFAEFKSFVCRNWDN